MQALPLCRWCSAAPSAYEPGKGSAWQDAWNLHGSGDDKGHDTDGDKGHDVTQSQYKDGTKYQAGQVVTNDGKLYRCKSFPYTDWCSMAAWAHEPGKGRAWQQAWEECKQ